MFLFGTRLRLLTHRVKEAIHIRLHPITSIGITVHNITAGQQQRGLKRKQHVLVGIIMSEMHEWQCTKSTNDDKQRCSRHVLI